MSVVQLTQMDTSHSVKTWTVREWGEEAVCERMGGEAGGGGSVREKGKRVLHRLVYSVGEGLQKGTLGTGRHCNGSGTNYP
jgi:hypothetical protein